MYLSSALGIPLIDYNAEDDKLVDEEDQKPNKDAKDERLKDIDEAHYVLTLDYTMKVCMPIIQYSSTVY